MPLNKNKKTTKLFFTDFHSQVQIGVGNAVNHFKDLNNFDRKL